ncbi:hypothetical protein PJP10_31405, partial [Mycobacterium kansasii]
MGKAVVEQVEVRSHFGCQEVISWIPVDQSATKKSRAAIFFTRTPKALLTSVNLVAWHPHDSGYQTNMNCSF